MSQELKLKDIKFDNEIWKDIVGYEGLYSVSSEGRIYSHRIKSLLKPFNDRNSYIRIGLRKTDRNSTKYYYIHRLVAEAFISKAPIDKPYINHKDENKSNNNYLNLEWCSIKENMNYGTRNKRISVSNTNQIAFSKKILCVTTNTIYPSIKEAERQTGVWNSNITKCCKNKRQTAGGYQWQYA